MVDAWSPSVRLGCGVFGSILLLVETAIMNPNPILTRNKQWFKKKKKKKVVLLLTISLGEEALRYKSCIQSYVRNT